MFGGGDSVQRKGLDAFAQRKWRRARRLLEEAVAEGLSPNGEYHLGLLYWRGLGGERDARAAVACFARASDEGHAAAQTALGVALAAGVGARRDVPEARALFEAASLRGDPVALTELAALSDPEEARRLLGQAADAGHVPAMRALGEMLMGVSPMDALSWLYAHVGLTGDHASIKRAAMLARELTADEIAEAQKVGRVYIRNAKQVRGK